jgi:hypothetical protein
MGQQKQKALNKIQEISKKMMRYSPEELSLIKNTFSDFNTLLVLRKYLLGGDMSEDENAELKTLWKKDALAVIRKTILPEIDPNAPVNEIVDMFSAINTAEITKEYAIYQMKARQITKDYLDKKLKKEDGITLKSLSYSPDKTDDQAYIDLSAQQLIVKHIEFQIMQLYSLGQMVEETPAEQAERLLKNSTQ